MKAAVDLFSQRGFRGTTTRELAAAVGVTEPVLYQHFAAKSDLYTAMVDAMIQRVPVQDIAELERLAKGNDDAAFFHEVGEQILSLHLDDTKYIRLLLFAALEGHELAEIWEERATKEFLFFIQRFIERRTREGVLEVNNTALAARAFVGMVGHFGMITALFKCPLQRVPREELLDEYVSMYLNGIRKSTEKK